MEWNKDPATTELHLWQMWRAMVGDLAGRAGRLSDFYSWIVMLSWLVQQETLQSLRQESGCLGEGRWTSRNHHAALQQDLVRVEGAADRPARAGRRVSVISTNANSHSHHHSLISIVPALLGSLAFLLGFVSNFWCESFQFTSDSAPELHFGPWYYRDAEYSSTGDYIVRRLSCTQFPSSLPVDGPLKTARAFSILTPLLAALGLFVAWLSPCNYRVNESHWRTVAVLFFVVSLFQGLSLMVLKSRLCENQTFVRGGFSELYSSSCELGQGAKANAASVALWVLTGVVMLVNRAPKRPIEGPPETQAVTYEQSVTPDGRVTVSETAVVRGTAVETA